MMHVSWTTLQEQIFAKLRRPYRSEANMNEVGHGEYMVFFEKFFVADSNQIAVSYCIGSVEFRYSKSSGH
jgi:hypothetical protein